MRIQERLWCDEVMTGYEFLISRPPSARQVVEVGCECSANVTAANPSGNGGL